MKTVFLYLLAVLVAVGPPLRGQDQDNVRVAKPFELYAQFLQDTRVDLSDGAVWMMDKGDCFPVYMFKDRQTKVILKLASATFQVDAANVKVLPETQNEAALTSYRKNLTDYLNKQPELWKKEAKKKGEGSEKAPVAEKPAGAKPGAEKPIAEQAPRPKK